MDEFAPIARPARYVWGIAAIAWVVIPGALITVFCAIIPSTIGAVICAALTLLGSVWLWWVTGRRWRAWGYAEREKELIIKHGVLFKHEVIVPYGRMQFVEIKQGPLDRIIGTFELQLHTAAAATDAKIPALPEQEAQRLRSSLTELGEAHAAGL